MKRASVLFAVLISVAGAAAFGATVSQETHEFRVGVATDFEGNDGEQNPPIYGGVGYFFQDDLEFGLYFSFRKTDWESYWGEDTAWGLGVFGERMFSPIHAVVPFATGRIGVLDGDETSDTAFNLAGGGGLRLFITQALSLSLQVELEWASDEVYDFDRETETEGSGENFDVTGRLGLRYFF